MNRNDDFDATLAAWLRRQAPPQAPDRVLYEALERVETESQRRGLLDRLLGGFHMSTILRATAVTAVFAIALLVGLQIGSLAPGNGTGSGSPTPSPTVGAPSPTPEPSPTLQPSAPLPNGCVIPAGDLADLIEAQKAEGADAAACYSDQPITVVAQWVGPGIPGCPSAPEPAWLACSAHSLQLPGEADKVGVPSLDVALDPSITALPDSGVDVRVTGHFDDARAETCRNTFALPDVSPEPDEVVVERCRQMFVITGIEELAS